MGVAAFIMMYNASQSGSLQPTVPVPTPLEEIDFDGISRAIFTGDSITVGIGASSFRERLTANYAWTASNLAASGQGVWYEASQLLNQTSITRAQTVAIMCSGLNTIRRSNAQKTFNKIESTLYTSICQHLLKEEFASGHSSITRVGTFAAYNADTYGGSYPNGSIPGNVCTASSAANSTWTYSFTGRGVFVQFISTDGSETRGACEIRIDGALVETITNLDDRMDAMVGIIGQPHTHGPDTRVWMGLSNEAHTIEVKSLSATAVVIDRFGTLDAPANLGVVFVIEVPKITNYSVTDLDQASDELITQVNELRKSIVDRIRSEGGFKIKFIPIMTTSGGLYNVSNTSDGIHPDTTGHDQIYDTIVNHIVYPVIPEYNTQSLQLVAASSQYANFGTHADIQFDHTAVWTLTGKFKFAGNPPVTITLFDNRNDSLRGIAVQMLTSGKIQIQVVNTSSTNRLINIGTPDLADNTWKTIQLTKINSGTGTSSFVCKINNAVMAFDSEVSNLSDTILSTDNILLGSNTLQTAFASMKDCQWAFWLSNQNAFSAHIHNLGKTRDLMLLPNPPLHYWPLNGDLLDYGSSANKLNGTGVNSPTFSADIP